MKNEKGVTLVALVTTIALIIILAAITTYTGIESYQSMRTQAFVSKMIALQEKVDTFCEKYTVSEINNMGVQYSLADSKARDVLDEVISKADTLNCFFDVDKTNSNYRYFSIDAIEEQIGLANFDVAIWLNPLTRNVIAVEGIKVDGVTYYRQYDLTGGQTLREPEIINDFTLEYKLLTYDNKAVVKFTREYKKVTYTYGTQTVSFNNVSEIELPYSGTYKIEVTYPTTSSGDVTKYVDGISVTIVNKPLLVDGMTPVMPEGATTYEEWYNYDSSVKNWANVKLKDGSVYVWIPRFAYKIDSSAKTIDVKFLKDFSEVTTEGKALATDYKIAPAFRNGASTAFANGEWDSEITGFWVAKYEAITATYNSVNVPTTTSTHTQCTRNITPANAFQFCRQMESASAKAKFFGNSLTGASGTLSYGIYTNDDNNIDTHLIKNSEWGAIAYLTWSSYGAGGNISSKDSYYIDENSGSTYCSTKTNTTGVYGLVGGAHDLVAAGPNIATYYNSSNVSTKYATVYNNDISASTIFGDAMKETMTWGQTAGELSNQLICRGGQYQATSGNSLLSYQNKNFEGTDTVTYRPVIIVEY